MSITFFQANQTALIVHNIDNNSIHGNNIGLRTRVRARHRHTRDIENILRSKFSVSFGIRERRSKYDFNDSCVRCISFYSIYRNQRYIIVSMVRLLNIPYLQIQQFSIQILHQKPAFNACGFFDINFTLIYMVRTSRIE